MTYDTYLIAEIHPALFGRQARSETQWLPYPVEGTLWGITPAGDHTYAVRVGSWTYTAQADDRLQIEAFG